MKASSFLLIFLGFLLLTVPLRISFAQSVTPTSSPAYAVIINQIRGESCCSPGNLEHTRTQLENAVKYELPTTFVLRYDALTDPSYTELILSYQRLHPTLVQTGVMVEIVPSLITDSNAQYCSNQKLETLNSKFEKEVEGKRTIFAVEMSPTNCSQEGGDCPTATYERCAQTECGARSSEQEGIADNSVCGLQYNGTPETWFQAQNAFTIGYPPDARTVILDTLLTQYYKVFGKYPTASSAWMIDTTSVNYLHDKYGVVTHQLTREQWGTDSYTLYGGPPHYPYPASRNWVMMPDYEQTDAVTIVRQTVTDPLYNYGDTSSTHTSQPNDYMRAGRDIEYFKTILDNAISQAPVGFANVGLENSMDEMYQNEYANQLAYVAKLRDEQKLAVIFSDSLGPIFPKNTITSYARTDGARQAIWITTPQYRARMIRKGGSVSLTDLRVYSKDLQDPYSTRVAKHEGYWVAPFLLDGSRWYEKKGITALSHVFIPIQNEYSSNPTRVEFIGNFTDTPLQISNTPQEIVVRDESGSHLTTFRVTTYNTYTPIKTVTYTPRDFPVQIRDEGFQWMTEGSESWSMRINPEVCGETCEERGAYAFSLNPRKFDRAVDTLYPYLYPEAVGRDLGMQYTRVSVNNTFAIAGRNPVRLVLEPHDAMNFPIILDAEAEITVSPDDTAVTRLGKLVSSQHQYIDLDRSDPQQVDVTVKMTQRGKYYVVRNTVYFAPNCKKDWKYCLTHPLHGVWYLLTQVSDRLAGRK